VAAPATTAEGVLSGEAKGSGTCSRETGAAVDGFELPLTELPIGALLIGPVVVLLAIAVIGWWRNWK